MLRTISLRNKLLLAVGLPMILLVAGAVFALQISQKEARSATTQSEAIAADLDLIALAQAIRAEQNAGLSGSSTDLVESRSVTDTRISAALSSTTDNEFRIGQMGDDIERSREKLGDDAETIRRASLEEKTAATGESTPTLDMQNNLGELAEGAVDLVEISGDRYESGGTATQIVTLINLATWEDAVSAERTSIELLPTDDAPPIRDQLDLLETSVIAEQAGEVALANGLSAFDMSETTDAPSTRALFRLREEIRSTNTEDLSNFTDDATQGAEQLIDGIQAQQDSITESIRVDIEQETVSATENQRNVLLGALVIAISAFGLLFLLYRAITQPITQLSIRGTAIAEEELPGMVSRIRSGESKAESQKIVPLESDTDDEIGELVNVFNNLHSTAVSLAAEQAQSRQVASEMFVNLGHRNQRILDTVLRDLDVLEQDEQDPDRLAQLYSVDQKVTRMRRNAESLLVLAGTQTPRQWAKPAPLADVVRASMSEVENFERVESSIENDLLIPGLAVADITHLLAELIENSLRFSPPEESVRVTSSNQDGKTIVTVADAGFGMNDEKLAEANEQIRAAANNNETQTKHLGHYVVGRLSARHGVTVLLERDDNEQGLIARVDLTEVTGIPSEPKVSVDSTSKQKDSQLNPDPDHQTQVKEIPQSELMKTPVSDETERSQHKPAHKKAAVEEPEPEDKKMPSPAPAVPASNEVANYSEAQPNWEDSEEDLASPATGDQEVPAAQTKQRRGGPDFKEMSKPRPAKRRVPGAALGNNRIPSKPKKTSPKPEAMPASPDAVRSAFTGFQKSATGSAQNAKTGSNQPPPSKPTPPPAATDANAPGKSSFERRSQPDLTEMTKPRKAKRRVPGASLPSSLKKPSNKPQEKEFAKAAKPEEVRDAFAGFQQSANPSDTDINTEGNES